MPTDLPFRFFDPQADIAITERHLPHWAQARTMCFLTWRTCDSLPAAVLERWIRDRDQWLLDHNIDAKKLGWKQELSRLSAEERTRFARFVFGRWESALDTCHGECLLRRPELATIVADSLRHFDGDRYILSDFVVMPNHVHVLAAFLSEEDMATQCDSWKHYTATQINRNLGRRGRFWESEGFDHLVRNEEQFYRFRKYLADNPKKANLKPGEYLHYSQNWG